MTYEDDVQRTVHDRGRIARETYERTEPNNARAGRESN